MTELVMLCGLPGSGKSTYAEQLKEKGYIIHSSDAIREELGDVNDQSKNEEVFRVLHKRIKDDLRVGKNVCWDSTNLNRRRRISFLRELSKIKCYKKCVLIATPYEICLYQNFTRDRNVPPGVVDRMRKNFNMPCICEGFDEVVVHYPNEEWRSYYGEIEDYIRSLRNYGQDNHHHKLTLGDHMLSAFDRALHLNGRVYDEVVLAALSHDIGKPDTRTFINSKGVSDNETHYFNHSYVGCYNSLFFEYPKYVNKEYVALLIELHMKPYLEWKQSEKALDKDRALFGESVINDVYMLHEADVYAH